MGQNKNGAATRTALYESARHCFYQKGYFATSVRDIIQNANSKLGLFSYHFKSKDAIAVMVFRQYVEDTSRTLYQAMGRKLDTCDLLLNDILNYRAYFKGILANENTLRFYQELSTTQAYLEQNFRFKEYYFHRLFTPQLTLDPRWGNETLRSVFISITAGMEMQLCRDFCSGNILSTPDEALDLYLETYYALLIKSRRQVVQQVQQSRALLAQVDWEVADGFVPHITVYYPSRSQDENTPDTQ